MVVSTVGISTVEESSTSIAGTTILVISKGIKKKVAACISGPGKIQMSTKESSKEANVTAGVYSGGATAAATRATLKMEFNLDSVCFTGRPTNESTKVTGLTECSTDKASSISRTASALRARSSRTSSMGRACFTSWTR